MGIESASSAPAELSFDLCIVGAGASGLTIASNFLKRSLSVCVLESGGVDGQGQPNFSGDGHDGGLPYASLATTRLKGLGGSTQQLGWGGFCKPLDRQDFVERTWVGNSGWPFDLEHLGPYYERACQTLGLGDVSLLGERQRLFPAQSPIIATDSVGLCNNRRLGRHFREPVKSSTSVDLFFDATVLSLEFAPGQSTIAAALCIDRHGRTFRVSARAFVIAAGGIENARLLMISNLAAQREPGLVGRYFMDHPRFTIGTLFPSNKYVRRVFAGLDRVRVTRRQRVARTLGWRDAGGYVVNGLTLPFEIHAKEALLNYRAWVEPCFLGQSQRAYDDYRLSLLNARDRLILSGRGSFPSISPKHMTWTSGMHLLRPPSLVRGFRLHHFIEPEPCFESRLALSDKKDRYGLPLVSLSWHLSGSTLDSLKRTIAILQNEMRVSGLGELLVTQEEWDVLQNPMWTWHHMGTTRIHDHPARGVVDRNCRVHGVSNLFVAGSSVFPTAGNDTPTLTIVALAHRLSDHLNEFAS
ncbi:GMC family oxidoreductase (plasmid) [Rhizobium sullae]|uniref:GMC family oxidoreductase n=1 Tax=Rhizobium sullae TaxID=50338 RepID=A0A2N0D7K5_RHISU|nr:GMC family oxidoreductase [Rhizobium sullae]PKA42094.1 GMC family oxidoreductase [Rhizobium sullae]UWU18399.1 GMC family oxidoreductase [Rhizobium sullae]